jgi:acetolactate synthase small subunit
MLIKVRARAPTIVREELKRLTDIFRAKMVDVTEISFMWWS